MKLAWNQPGERRYETGVDRGVLYLPLGGAVPWNGLTSVKESATGGETKPYYLDGVKYLNVSGREEFKATLEAFTYPEEFVAFDGWSDDINGLHLGNQKRKSFNFCYRTLLGNDLLGIDHGYKIHLIYNAVADPDDRGYDSIEEQASAMGFSWDITTTPIFVPGYKPTSHFVIDSRKTPKQLLRRIEDILYGTEANEPRIPLPDELYPMFSTYVEFVVTLNVDGTFTASGEEVTINGDGSFTLNHELVIDNGDGSFTIMEA